MPTEILWGVHLKPTPLEAALLAHPYLARLQGVRHYGLAADLIGIRHSRLTHTLGVYALCVHFRPQDLPLRAAALLHDAGHLPFSHAAERALGYSHHQVLAQLWPDLDFLLSAHGLDPDEVLRLIEEPSVLKPGRGLLGLDHLDSFVRNAVQSGTLERADDLLAGLCLVDGAVSADPAGAEVLLGCIKEELTRLSSVEVAWGDHLSERVVRRADLTLSDWLRVGEEELLVPEDHRLLRQPISAHLAESPGAGAYLNLPLVLGRPLAEVWPQRLAEMQARLWVVPRFDFS